MKLDNYQESYHTVKCGMDTKNIQL